MGWHVSSHPQSLMCECVFFLLSELWAEETSATPGPAWSTLMEMLGVQKLEALQEEAPFLPPGQWKGSDSQLSGKAFGSSTWK